MPTKINRLLQQLEAVLPDQTNGLPGPHSGAQQRYAAQKSAQQVLARLCALRPAKQIPPGQPERQQQHAGRGQRLQSETNGTCARSADTESLPRPPRPGSASGRPSSPARQRGSSKALPARQRPSEGSLVTFSKAFFPAFPCFILPRFPSPGGIFLDPDGGRWQRRRSGRSPCPRSAALSRYNTYRPPQQRPQRPQCCERGWA